MVARAPLNPFGMPPQFGEETDTTRHMDNDALRQEQTRIIEGCLEFVAIYQKEIDAFLLSRARPWPRGIISSTTAAEGDG